MPSVVCVGSNSTTPVGGRAKKENIRQPELPDVFRRGENSVGNWIGRNRPDSLAKKPALVQQSFKNSVR